MVRLCVQFVFSSLQLVHCYVKEIYCFEVGFSHNSEIIPYVLDVWVAPPQNQFWPFMMLNVLLNA